MRSKKNKDPSKGAVSKAGNRHFIRSGQGPVGCPNRQKRGNLMIIHNRCPTAAYPNPHSLELLKYGNQMSIQQVLITFLVKSFPGDQRFLHLKG